MIRKLLHQAAAVAQDPFMQGMTGLLLVAVSFKGIATEASALAQRVTGVGTRAAQTLHASVEMADAAEAHVQRAQGLRAAVARDRIYAAAGVDPDTAPPADFGPEAPGDVDQAPAEASEAADGAA